MQAFLSYYYQISLWIHFDVNDLFFYCPSSPLLPGSSSSCRNISNGSFEKASGKHVSEESLPVQSCDSRSEPYWGAAKDLLSLCSPGFFDHSNLCNEQEKLTPTYLLAAR